MFMNIVRITLLSLMTIAHSLSLNAVHYHAYYGQTQPTHIHHCADCISSNPFDTTPYKPTTSGYHGFMLTLARNPELGSNAALIYQLSDYLQHCWSSEKQEIFVALASNPSLIYNTELVQALTRYMNSCWSSEKHALVKALARNPYIGSNDDIVQACIGYINTCWRSEKKEILMIFASNPSTCHNYTLTTMLQKEMQYRKEQQKLEALFTIGAGAVLLTAVFVNWCCNETPRTTYYYAQ